MKSAVVREAISLVFALKEFESMIRNHDQPVFVLTDASSLIFITKKSVQSKCAEQFLGSTKLIARFKLITSIPFPTIATKAPRYSQRAIRPTPSTKSLASSTKTPGSVVLLSFITTYASV